MRKRKAFELLLGCINESKTYPFTNKPIKHFTEAQIKNSKTGPIAAIILTIQ